MIDVIMRRDAHKNNTDTDPDWSNKRTFPPTLIDPVKALGHKAIDLRVMDEPFFDVMPQFIRYNRFTMKKWMLNNCREYLPVSIAEKEKPILKELEAEIARVAPGQIEERNVAVEAWQAEREFSFEAGGGERSPQLITSVCVYRKRNRGCRCCCRCYCWDCHR